MKMYRKSLSCESLELKYLFNDPFHKHVTSKYDHKKFVISYGFENRYRKSLHRKSDVFVAH